MTPEELLEAQQEQTPLVWRRPYPAPPEIVTVHPHGDPLSRWDQEYVARVQRAYGAASVYPEDLRPATAQELLELGEL